MTTPTNECPELDGLPAWGYHLKNRVVDWIATLGSLLPPSLLYDGPDYEGSDNESRNDGEEITDEEIRDLMFT